MYKIDFNNPIHIHFIGIGGISMSGLAKILLSEGFTVSGSDAHSSALTDELIGDGCIVSVPQSAGNITNDIDLVVYTAAIHPDNPEFKAAKEAGLPMLTRAELLGQIMTIYKNAINIAGTHGKTTTTSMVSEILLAANMDPTISVGGILNSIGGNTRVGCNKYFVAEACEYTNSFLSFNPTMNIILNVKEDHLDFFKDIDDIRHSFKLFTEKLPSDGTLIINTDIDNYEYFYQDTDCEVITFGSDPAKSMYSASDITYDELGRCTYSLLINGEKADTITLGVPGLHNVYNSLAAIAAARKLSVDMEHIKAGLSNFKGTNRRFEKKGTFNGVTVIDDYAHHPDEIRATLSSAATFILCAADKVLMSDAAVVMIHNTQSSWGGGDYRDAQMTADMLREFNESVLNVYEKKTGKSREELQAMMDKDTFMSPKTAIENGFADGMLFEDGKDDESSQMNFIEASKQMAVYNSTLPVISDEKAHELMLLLNSGKLPERKVLDDLNSNKADKPSENADTNKNNITNENNGKEQNMTLEEMLKEHPELKAEVDGLKAEAKAEGEKEGADKERGRIENLDKIAANVSAEMLKNAKYGDADARVDARELAYQAMLAQKQEAAAYMRDAMADSKESGAGDVGASLSDSDKDLQDVENMAAYVNGRRGGKR